MVFDNSLLTSWRAFLVGSALEVLSSLKAKVFGVTLGAVCWTGIDIPVGAKLSSCFIVSTHQAVFSLYLGVQETCCYISQASRFIFLEEGFCVRIPAWHVGFMKSSSDVVSCCILEDFTEVSIVL